MVPGEEQPEPPSVLSSALPDDPAVPSIDKNPTCLASGGSIVSSSSIPQIIRKGKVMKTLSCALLLMASMAFVLLGCSDNSALPVSPTDQSAGAPASLGKSTNVEFTLTSFPIYVDPQPDIKIAGRTLHMKNVAVVDLVTATDTRVSGRMEHYLSLKLDIYTGEGPCHGSWTSEPAGANGGKWEGTYEGYRSKTSEPFVFTLPLKLVARGRGGNIDGMQTFMTATLRVTTDLAHYPLPTGWTAVGEGFIKEH